MLGLAESLTVQSMTVGGPLDFLGCVEETFVYKLWEGVGVPELSEQKIIIFLIELTRCVDVIFYRGVKDFFCIFVSPSP